MNRNKSAGLRPILAVILAVAVISLAWCAMAAHGQTPSLVVSAGSGNISVTSDTTSPWKQFHVTGGSAGTYNVTWAESNGATGGIFYGTITTSSSAAGLPIGPPTPTPPPTPTDLPLGALTTAAAAAIAGVPADQLSKMADLYEGLASAIDKGVIASPLQLQIGTGTQLLSVFTADQLASFKNLTTAVNGWLDAQQCAGRLTADGIPKYARAYHAIAAAIRPDTVTPPAAPAKVPRSAETPTGNSSCASGRCPPPAQNESRRRGR